jgi:nicotinamidase-related amidase
MTTALLIIDAQVNMFGPEAAYDAPALRRRLQHLADAARDANVPVIFVRNNGSDGDPDVPNTPGWHIDPALAAADGTEPVIDKWASNSFEGTRLAEELRVLGVDHVAIAGLQSDYCVSATVRGAIAEGLQVTLVRDAHSTYDGDQPAAQIIEAVNDQLSGEVDLRDAASLAATW